LVLYAGALGIVNGVDYLVRMAARLLYSAPEVRIAIVGSGREERGLRALASQLGVLDRNLFLLGAVSKARVAAYFGACDMACSTVIEVPALSANSANKVFDTWAAGRPVAINHDGWIADIIRKTGAGLLLPAGDPDGASSLVRDFLLDSDRVASSRAAAQRLARERFSRDRLFRDFETVLLRAVDAHPHRSKAHSRSPMGIHSA
jgi:glycosyltransferase involved in cell wall biosynthesis